ncbi:MULTISPECIES: hypothetical protein [unclassified Streptomyces]|uniref:DUF7848 domain-containing protein n=1 Tax=unclassified Streptomyces TaxID=2593676 RepID=UPI00125E8B9C|nr:MULTISPECIES: hypothetical protein [unclassified Streptomyces]
MTVRSVIREAEWVIGADRSEGAPPSPIRETECTTCQERSAASCEQPGPDLWAIRHAARTRHTGFREVVTAFPRVTPAPGNPLYGRGERGRAASSGPAPLAVPQAEASPVPGQEARTSR